MPEQKLTIEKIVKRLSLNLSKNIDLFHDLSDKRKASVLSRAPERVKIKIIDLLDDDELVRILISYDPDEATDIIQLLTKKRQKQIIAKLDEQHRTTIEILLKFPPDVAAGLMKINYIQVDKEETLEAVGKKFKQHEERTGRLPEIIVVSEGKLVGYVPGHILGLSYPDEQVGKYVKRAIKVKSETKRKEVINTFRNYPHSKIIVLDSEENVLGVIYSDDVLRLLSNRETASLYSFAGVTDEESVFDPSSEKIRHRYKWLILNLFTGFIAAFTVSLFNETISKYVLLAVYMPIVAGMGGNAATQTLAIMVRGISMNHVSMRNIFIIIKDELGAALFNGFLNGVIISVIVLLFNRDVKLAIVLASAMIINLVVAAIFGTLIPVIMKRLGKDPATSATILITTATDVLGFMAFLGLATLILA